MSKEITIPDSLWCAEFCGFFWGEGNLMIDIMERTRESKRKLANGDIRSYGMKTYFNARVRCRLIQRDDDRKILEHIKSTLGGHLYVHKSYKLVSGGNGKEYINHAQITWQVQDREQVDQILDILERGQLPARKRLQIAVMREAIELMRNRTYNYTQEQREKLKELQHRLFALRRYVD